MRSEMEVRLAYERGSLRTNTPNRFQEWALSYWLYMDRRIQREDVRAVQELQTYDLNFARWREIYLPQTENVVVEGEAYEAVTEYYPSEIDAFLSKHGNADPYQVREMTGSELYGLEV